MDIIGEIRQLAEAGLNNPALFVVDVIVSSKNGPRKVLVLLDGDQGVSIDDCANLSRELSKALDEVSWMEDSYTLEVSTPGVDHPLKLKRQYNRNIGRKLKVKVADKTIEGRLSAVNEEKIILIQETGSGKKKEEKPVEVLFSEIEKAFVIVSFK
ncbi:MAG TPA: ribosome maturation factor RimP [Ohtaekwangia sp.]